MSGTFRFSIHHLVTSSLKMLANSLHIPIHSQHAVIVGIKLRAFIQRGEILAFFQQAGIRFSLKATWKRLAESPSDGPILPLVYTATVACIYITLIENAKACSPLSASTFYKGLLKRQNTAAYMTTFTRPQLSLASDLVGLITRKDTATSRHASQRTKNPFSRMLPTPHRHRPTMASPLDYDPTLPQYWSEHPRDKAFGANCNAFSSKLTGFSICHPIYHENTMYLATRHEIYSAALSTEATATFMFLPSWNKRMTINPTHCFADSRTYANNGLHTIRPTPICRNTLLEQYTDAPSQTHLGGARHCHM